VSAIKVGTVSAKHTDCSKHSISNFYLKIKTTIKRNTNKQSKIVKTSSHTKQNKSFKHTDIATEPVIYTLITENLKQNM
jgi:hypothetical protein